MTIKPVTLSQALEYGADSMLTSGTLAPWFSQGCKCPIQQFSKQNPPHHDTSQAVEHGGILPVLWDPYGQYSFLLWIVALQDSTLLPFPCNLLGYPLEFLVFFHSASSINHAFSELKRSSYQRYQWIYQTGESLGESPLGLNPIQKAIGNWENLGAEKIVFPMEEQGHKNWFSSTNDQLCKIHTSNILQTEYMYIYMLEIYV